LTLLAAGAVLWASPALAVCGNGSLDAGEGCDDGNLVDGDGCSSECDECLGLDASGDRDGDGVCLLDNDDDPLDCDDSDPTIHPLAPELCNGRDDDCNPSTAFAGPGAEADADGDGVMACSEDCNDFDARVHPGAPELCNGYDDDCDGDVPNDELDEDLDGWRRCNGDCDDDDDQLAPWLPERCNGIDDDCDGELPPMELDADADGAAPCEGDCDDLDPEVGPQALERCNGIDDDCNARVDDGTCDEKIGGGLSNDDGRVGGIGSSAGCGEPPAAMSLLPLVLLAVARRPRAPHP
jgi:cysteine-rich repeat protein